MSLKSPPQSAKYDYHESVTQSVSARK